MTAQKFELLFQEAYNKLNQEQKAAVDTLDGPVMVIAGPGTGKTQILSTRIANLLYQSVADPENILCLTYTEAGAIAMRKRLHELIGAGSKNVSIHTFHSFCNKVILENPGVFNTFSEFSIADKLDEYEILDSILLKMASSNTLFRPDQNYKSILGRILGLFQTVKKENWNVEELKLDIRKVIDDLEFQPQFIYKRKTGKFEKGDLKIRELKIEELKFQQTISALELYKEYNDQLRVNGLLDFNDLINNVIREFGNNNDLLSTYQEKYQYILVDEFQDTNGSQLDILNLLSSYWDNPNLFVVGDSDQAIYRFQGASITNITNFINKYDPTIIELNENYRSTQKILNIAESFISTNKERLKAENSHNALKSNRDEFHISPKIKIFNSLLEETFEIVNQIEDLIVHQKTPPGQIAILYRKNSNADDYVKELLKRNISFSQSKEINVLNYSIINQVLKIVHYLHLELNSPLENDFLLFEILHFPFVDIPTVDIGKISLHLKNIRSQESNNNTREINLRLLCSEFEWVQNLELKEPNNLFDIISVINNLIKSIRTITLENLIERILYDFNIIPFVLNEWKNYEALEIINSFYEYIRSLTIKYPEMDIFKLNEIINRLSNYNIQVPFVKTLSDNNSVRLSTIHSSKGMEYEYVFMVRNNASRNSNIPTFKLPPGYSYNEQETDSEDGRRLFYVGITRAKKFLQISYSNIDNNGKLLEAGVNVQELLDEGQIDVEKTDLPKDQILQAIENKLEYIQKELTLVDEEYLEKFLSNFSLSSTSMEKYLECPISFYYERVLGVPNSRSIYMGFGSAVHATLERYLKKYRTASNLDSIYLSDLFRINMNKVKDHFTTEEFNAFSTLGLTNLPKLLQNNESKWNNLNESFFEKDYRNRQYQNIPISGKIDRIDKCWDGYRIIDYKTGKVLSNQAKEKLRKPSEKLKYGGEYWRQMIFYSLLCDTDPAFFGKVQEGILYYVIPDQFGAFHEHSITITSEDQQFVGNLITQVYSKIQNKEFTQGCGKPECRWCHLLQKESVQSENNRNEIISNEAD